jgi:hypothetical protein
MQDYEHPFYAKSPRTQKRVQLQIAATSLAVNLLVGALSLWVGWYFLPLFCITATLSLVAPFYHVPSQKNAGKLIYYSPLFIAEVERDGVIKIHGGTLFDYVFVVDRSLSEEQRRDRILLDSINGFLRMVDSHSSRDLELISIIGTSYFISERTAVRIGLRRIPTDPVQVLILGLNYFNLTVSYSIARAKLAFPRLGDIGTYKGRLADVAKNADYLRSLQRQLSRRCRSTVE